MDEDPRALLRATAAAAIRGERARVLLPCLPPVAAVLAAAAFGKLPLELAWAGMIGAALVAALLAALSTSELDAAAFLDRSLGGREHFLTLASVRTATLLPVVEEGARALVRGRSVEPSPRRLRPTLWTSALSLLALALLWFIPAELPAEDLGAGLDIVAAELEVSAQSGDRALAAELRSLARQLRDPAHSLEAKKKDVAAAREKLEGKQSGGSDGGAQQKNEQQSQHGRQQGSSAQQQSEGARGKAKQELDRVSGRLEGKSQGEKTSASQGEKSTAPNGEKKDGQGGGIQGPSDGAKKREQGKGDGEGSANQETRGQGQKPDPKKSGEGQGGDDSKNPESAEPQKPGSGQGGGQRDRQAAGGGAGAGSTQPQPGPDEKADRYYQSGESGDGTIEGGRYVRVRVPQDGPPAEDVERVAKPGDPSPQTPYGNAPLPGPGSPGEVSEQQPVPLEYRAVLGR